MSCTIPNFNLSVKVTYDLTQSNPTITIDNLSTGASMAGIKFWFVIATPSGVVFHQGSYATPDATGIWSTVNISETIPQTDGHIEFNTALPYIVDVFAQDGSGNSCNVRYEDIICKPNGGSGKDNFGGIFLNSNQNCEKGFLEIVDQSNYQYKGITGNMVSNMTKFVYPTDNNGTTPTPTTVNNKMSFLLPIPVNGKGHQLIRNATLNYVLQATGSNVLIKYKYKNSDIEINCGFDLCSIMCGLTKYRNKLESCTSCQGEKNEKITDLTLKIAELSLAISSPLCGYDIASLQKEIKEILLVNDCYCDDCGPKGNNPTFALRCSDIDIACVSAEIINLINADAQVKASWCSVVTSCVNAISGGCQTPIITGLVSNSTQINVNFVLPIQGSSQNLEVFYKLAASGSWTSAGVVASNATAKVITGTFTSGDIYQVKVTNHCSGNTDVDSIISSTTVITSLTQCSLLQQIYGTPVDGYYVVQMDNAQTGCNQLVPTKLNSQIIKTFLPCTIPLNFKVSAVGILSWTGELNSDYRISYKLKINSTWIIHNTATYVGPDSTFSIVSAASLPNPVQDYDFKIEKYCGGTSYSQPIYCSYDLSASTGCKSPSGFIEWSESTGICKFYGGVPSGTYLVTAWNQTTNAALAAPSSVTVDANGIISANFASILSSGTSIGDKVVFSVKTDCGSGNYSESVSFTYKRVGTTQSCPQQPVVFNPSTMVSVGEISGNRIELQIPSGTLLSSTRTVLYRMRIGGVEITSGVIMPTASVSTYIESPKKLKNGDVVEFSTMTYCNCCDNYTTNSGWSSWFGGAISINNGWDDEWYALPGSGALQNSHIVSPTYSAKFKYDNNGNIHLRGAIRSGTIANVPTGNTTINLSFLDLSGGTIFANAKNSIVSTPDYDVFPVSFTNDMGCTVRNAYISRNGSVLTLYAIFNNGTGSALTNVSYEFSIGHIILR